jgi:hypothetical protein
MKREVWEVNRNSDLTEGRGHAVTLGLFPNRDEALKVVNDPRYSRWSVMGVHTPGAKENEYNIRSTTLTVYDTAEEFWAIHDENEKRKRELAKLDAEERRLLGLPNSF